MKTPAFFALLGLVVSPLSVVHALSPPADSVHFSPVDYEQWERDHPRPAAKRLTDLNVGPPRTVRLIYFLPNDRPYRAEVVYKIKTMARRVQTFYAEQMQAHGHGDRTFRLEIDAAGSPKVHRVDGRHSDSHYLDYTLGTVQEELLQAFDLWSNIYIVVIDNSIHGIGFWGRLAGGVGTKKGKVGGLGVFHEGSGFGTMAHELGHTFGLEHDFRDDADIMSYGGRDERLSACAAGFLAVHPYFNRAVPTSEAQRPTIELISPRYHPAGANSASVQLRVRDSDGLHHVTLFTHTRKPHFAAGAREVKACRVLVGEREAVVEFDYDGVVPSAPLTTGLSMSVTHSIEIEAVDKDGNVGYEHFTLAEISSHYIATLEGHGFQGYPVHVAFSPDGETLASGADRKIQLWDVATKKNIATLPTLGWFISSLSFSPDGETLATGAADGAVTLWDVDAKKNIATLETHSISLSFSRENNISLSFSPDGETLATGAANGAVKLWDVDAKKNIATLEEPKLEDNVRSMEFLPTVAFSPDGETLAAGSMNDDGLARVTLWDVVTKKNIATLGAVGAVYSVAFSPDGAILAAGRGGRDTVQLWDVDTKTNIANFEVTGAVYSVAFSPDGAILAAGSGNGVVQLWDVDTKTNVTTFTSTGFVSSVLFSPDGAILATGIGDDTVQLWDVSEWTGSRLHSQVETSDDEQQETEQKTEQKTTTDGQSTSQTLDTVSGEGQEGPASTQLDEPFAISVVDEDGAAVAGVDVTFAVTAGGGMLSAATDANPCIFKSSKSSITATTDANGQAATRLTLGSEPGTNTVEVTIEGLEPVTFTATATEQAMPHRLTKVCGDDQEGTVGALLTEPLVVSVSDEGGAAMAGVVVSFAVTTGGGTLSSATATTDANGRAVTRLTLGSEVGTNMVSATVEGLESVTFTATGQEDPLVSLFGAFGSGKLIALPDRTQLLQNAPNPFNSQTVLSYFLLEPGSVRLEVFSLSGQRIAVLHQGPQQAGYHRLHWDGRDATGHSVASGPYLYRLVTSEDILTRKLILLR